MRCRRRSRTLQRGPSRTLPRRLWRAWCRGSHGGRGFNVVPALPVLLVRFDLFGASCLSIGPSISGAELTTGLTLPSRSVTFIVFHKKIRQRQRPQLPSTSSPFWRPRLEISLALDHGCGLFASSVLQCTPVYSSVLQCTLLYSSVLYCTPVYSSVLQCTPVYSSVL